jgi:4-hydroxymandelate oxidase
MINQFFDQNEIVNVNDYEAYAKNILDPAIWAYFSGAAGDELSQHRNLKAWRDINLQPRALTNLCALSTETTILDRKISHPIFIAPFAFQKLLHPQGETACAYASAVLEAGFVLSDQSSRDPVAVANIYLSEENRGLLWHQLYWTDSRERIAKRLIEIEQSGYEAIVLTVDAPAHGARDRERRAGFQPPQGIQFQPALAPASSTLESLLAYAPSWNDVEWLVQTANLPVLVKGILHPGDAQLAQNTGCAGIIVSNHGGRVLDTVVPTAWVLSSIREAVGDSIHILVDGGIRRGTDILKAIALGADAVMIGKPIAMALGAKGPEGVAHVIRLLWDELKLAMALTGCSNLQNIPSDLVHTAQSH